MHIYYYIRPYYILIQTGMMSQNQITNENKDVCIQLDTQMYQLLQDSSIGLFHFRWGNDDEIPA